MTNQQLATLEKVDGWQYAAQLGYSQDFNSGSTSAIYIEMYFNEEPLGHGITFWACLPNGKKDLLFTAKHLVRGEDFFTKKAKSERPNHIYCLLPNKSNGDRKYKVSFYHSDTSKGIQNTDVGSWLEHPTQVVDVEAFRFDETTLIDSGIDCRACCVQLNTSTVQFDIAKQIYVLGFPFKRLNNYYAVWSAGTISYEPSCDFPFVYKTDKTELFLPAYLINARTFSGQSGSLVIANPMNMPYFNNGIRTLRSGADETILGMYTCRLHPEDNKKQFPDLGLVWKQSVLIEFFNQLAL